MHSHPHSPGPANDDHADRLRQLSPNLYWYRDTCNVYLLKDGERGLLIDFGSGGVLDHLDGAGVKAIDGCCTPTTTATSARATHCWSRPGSPIAVPDREAALFAEADAFWRLRRQISTTTTLRASATRLPGPVPVAGASRLRDVRLARLPDPGPAHAGPHQGSVSYLAEIDGAGLAFCGDLIAEPGRRAHASTTCSGSMALPDARRCGAPLGR